MKRINHDDPRWTDFVLSELPEHEMAALRQVMENDAAVQTVLAETDQLACLIREGFSNEVYELGESRREAIRKAGRIPDKGTVVSMTRRRRDWVRPAAVAAAAALMVGCFLWVMQQIPVGEDKTASISNVADSRYREVVRRQILLGSAPRVTRPMAGGAGAPLNALTEEIPVVLPEVPTEFIEEEYLMLRKLWDEYPERFIEEVQTATSKAQLSMLSHIAPMADNPFISAESKPESVVPVVSGTASYQVVERFVRGEMKLPPRGSVRIEELINHLSYGDDGGANLGKIRLSVEVASCPWDRELILMGVLLENGSEAVVASETDVIVTMDPDLVKSYRLMGYAGREDPEIEGNSGPSSAGLAPGRSNYVLYQIRPRDWSGTEFQKVMARVSLRAGVPAGELVVPVTSPPKDWMLASSNLKTAVALSAWGMVLRQSPFGSPLTHFDIGRMAKSALEETDASELKRREAMQLILDSLPLFEIDSGS